jgi:hypothetical protein
MLPQTVALWLVVFALNYVGSIQGKFVYKYTMLQSIH